MYLKNEIIRTALNLKILHAHCSMRHCPKAFAAVKTFTEPFYVVSWKWEC